MAALHLWHYLDWAFVFLQLCAYAFDEGAGAGRTCEGVSGADVAGDGVVPVVGAGSGADGDALFFLDADHRRAQLGRFWIGVALVWLVGAGLGGGVRGNLFLSASGQGNSRFGLGTRSWDRRAGDRGFMDSHGAEWRRARIERASGHQRGWRAGVDDAAKYVGRGVACAKEIDCVDAGGHGAGDADAG